MKRVFVHTLWVLLMLGLSSGCKHHTIIPDDELALIFHDAFLANSLLEKSNAKRDSLLVYEPIFERYGYTTEDVRYTIGNFSKRKSARLGDVVELAIDRLETEGLRLEKAVAALDTVNNVARRAFKRTFYSDSLIRVTRLKDTTRLRLEFDSIRRGEYTLSVRYEVDSMDENRSQRMQLWMERYDSSQLGLYTQQLNRFREGTIERTLASDSSVRRLVIDFWRLPPKAKPQRPSITLRDLKITFTPPPAEAVDSLYERDLKIRIFAHDFLRALRQTDSLPLPADSAGVASAPAR